mgnify:CR=1 FL=1
MYNVNFNVKYHDIETELLEKLDNKTKDEYDECVEQYVSQDVIDICEKLYRDEILTVFDADTIEDDKISQTLKHIFPIIIANNDFSNTLTELKIKINNLTILETPPQALNTSEIIFCSLFCHQMFHITHKCVCQILKTATIDIQLIEEFKRFSVEMLKN